MEERIDCCNVLYDSWQLQCCGDPVEVGRAATFTIDDLEYPDGIAGYHIDFHEEHHGNAIAKIRGLVVGIKTVFVDEFADGKKRIDNPHNTFVIYDATFVDGFGDKGSYGIHRICDADYYIIIMRDVIVGEYEGRYEHRSNIEGIVLKPINDGKVEVAIRNIRGDVVGGLTGVTVSSGGQERRIIFPAELRKTLFQWFADYKAHINDGFLIWSQDDWNVWYVKGWNIAEMIKELLPDDVHIYYGTVGMSQGVIRFVNGHWQINESMHRVQIVDDKSAKMEKGEYFSSVYGDVQFDLQTDQEFDCTYGIYKIPIPRPEHHLFPQDTVVLHNLTIENQEDCLGIILDVQDDGIIVEVFGYMGCDEYYSLELIG